MPFSFQALLKKYRARAPAQADQFIVPLLDKLALEMQFRILGIVFVISLLLAIAMIYVQIQNTARGSAYTALAGHLRPLAQQIPKATRSALQGESRGFDELDEARGRFNRLLAALAQGGEIDGVKVFATGGPPGVALDALRQAWMPQDAILARLETQKKSLLLLGGLVNESVARGPAMLADAETAGGQLPALTGRILYAITRLSLTPEITLGALLQLVKDIDAAHRLAPAGGMLARGLTAMEGQLAALPVDIRPASQARVAGATSAQQGGLLARAVDELLDAYGREFSTPKLVAAGASFSGSLALVTLVLMVMLYNRDSARRRIEAERQQRLSEAAKDATQNAILRLLNEMSDLADGDLTVRATVTEDVTGAIADAINYAIGELAVLVRSLNDAAERVTYTTDRAQAISHDLLAATEAQANEIRGAGTTVLATARSMNAASASAQESARVARVSLDAAQKGAQAVADSIAGMHEIRGQIQETAKRIKRLGESSQEIGEIVELISDISEQTNVLALNAAIQAASAGEAGRGFSVVAEEVQRLAERSAAATQQIAVLVRTIQTDTHDAVAAMENSTQGVVAGARLSDAAGQSLAEISRVSQDLAQRVEAIAGVTQTQAGNATQVATSMRHILDVTGQTSTRTQETAVSIAELAQLAVELKGSVAGFKL